MARTGWLWLVGALSAVSLAAAVWAIGSGAAALQFAVRVGPAEVVARVDQGSRPQISVRLSSVPGLRVGAEP